MKIKEKEKKYNLDDQERQRQSSGQISTAEHEREKNGTHHQQAHYQEQSDRNSQWGRTNKQTRGDPLTFNFDYIFDGNTKQSEVYKIVAKPVLENVFQGWNGTIFAYGQTSSGKTYTMQGALTNEKLKGIIPRIVDGIFAHIDDAPENIEFIIKVSMLEIYMEGLTDLLNINGTKSVKIRETPTKGIYIENMLEYCVGDEDEVMDILTSGNQNRKIGRTDMNEVSSR